MEVTKINISTRSFEAIVSESLNNKCGDIARFRLFLCAIAREFDQGLVSNATGKKLSCEEPGHTREVLMRRGKLSQEGTTVVEFDLYARH